MTNLDQENSEKKDSRVMWIATAVIVLLLLGGMGANMLFHHDTLNDPTGVALDEFGDIFIADNYNEEIREVVESSSAAAAYKVAIGDIITVAGSTSPGCTGGYKGDG